MEKQNKTHYRKVFKSDHLGTPDLEEFIEEGKHLIFTIREVKQHLIESGNKNSGVVVAGKRISANIAYFTDAKIKPLVLNATNSKIVKSFNGGSAFVEDWSNTPIELYIDASVRMKGEVVGGVRIKTTQPKLIDDPKLKELKDLFDIKKESISKESMVRIEKTINNKVSANYEATINYLKTL